MDSFRNRAVAFSVALGARTWDDMSRDIVTVAGS
jgi:hypothetical protein